MTAKNVYVALILFVMSSAPSFAQEEHASLRDNSGVNKIARTTQAIQYRRGDTTEVDLNGTPLMPHVTGKAKIINKKGLTDVHVDVENLLPARTIDAAYLTYVVWAISPEGNAKNIGELVGKDGKASVHTAGSLQAFALVITAEPDFAVTQPSELVVAENSVRAGTKGIPEPISVRYEVQSRRAYVPPTSSLQGEVAEGHKIAPLDLLEARNAVRIAKDAHAEEYAADTLRRAQTLLSQAEDDLNQNQSDKSIGTVAREAVQTAEEARAMAIKEEHQARIERERRESEERTERAQTRAENAEQQAEQSEAERQAAARRAEQERTRADEANQQAQAEAEQRRRIEKQNQLSQQQAQQAQQQAEQAQQQAQIEAQQRTAAEQQAQQASQQANENRQQAQEAQQRAQQAEAQQQQLRQQLRDQLNQILETRDTARGLIVSMPDVLFDTGSANLKSTARERLAKVAGILIAHPDIKVEVDGYTDSTGDPMSNERLSQERAASVQSYLSQQGVSAGSISIHGFGEANPVASNDSSVGRQQNRRVELVVTGESIGTAQMTLGR